MPRSPLISGPTMRDIRIRPRAQSDIESVFAYIAVSLGSPQAARGIVDELYASFERIAAMPTAGMVFTSEDLDHEFRRVLTKNYWVYYTFDDESVVVWRVFHARHNIDTCTLVDF